MTRLQKVLLAGATLCLLATSRFACQRIAERGRFVAAYSSYGSGPLGTRALYLLTGRLGAHPQRWAQDLAALPKGALLVALSDCESGLARSLSRYEQQELVRWVADGGVVLVAGARGYLPEELPVGFESEACGDEREHGRETWQAAAAGAPLVGLGPMPMREPGRVVLDEPERAQVILTLPDAPGMPESPVQRVAGAIAPHGKGHVIVLAAASMLQNRALASADGGVLFARLLARYAPEGPVLFDEYHLGVGERRSMMRYLRQAGATPFIVQLLFVALLLLWRAGARFGGVRAPRMAVAMKDDASFVTALGDLFARAGSRAGAQELLVRQALARVARHHHVPPMPAGHLAVELEARGRTAAAEAVRELGGIDAASGRDLAAQSRALDALVARACR